MKSKVENIYPVPKAQGINSDTIEKGKLHY